VSQSRDFRCWHNLDLPQCLRFSRNGAESRPTDAGRNARRAHPGHAATPDCGVRSRPLGPQGGRRIIIQGNNPERTWSCSRLATRPAANHHPHYRPSTIANVSGTAVRNRDPPIRDYFQNAGRFFQKTGIEERWLTSYRDTVQALRHPGVLERAAGCDAGIFVFDFPKDGG
jgi:hypothetical protein